MNKLVGLFILICSIAGCTKDTDGDTGSPVFEAVIDGSLWKATTVKAVLNADVQGNQGNFYITGYTNDGRVIYLQTKENTISNLNFREQLVNLVSLTATTNIAAGQIALNWRTSAESNADKFEVERSVDGINFVRLVAVKAKGNSDTLNTYTHTDRPPFSDPFNNKTYYRLRMVDLDASFAYSQVIVVRFGSPVIYKYSDNTSDYAYGYSGNVNLSEVNTQKRIISGTFNFSYTISNTGQPGKIETGVFRNIPY